LLGGPARAPEDRLTQREMDLARSIRTSPRAMLKDGGVCASPDERDLCMAGGVAPSVGADASIARTVRQIWVQPAPGVQVARWAWRWASGIGIGKPRQSPEQANVGQPTREFGGGSYHAEMPTA
jgi:carbamoyltransferase